jgi:anaphase-promoting complex subunit 4
MSASTTKATHQSTQTQPQPITYTPLPPSKLPTLLLPTGSAPPASTRPIISFSASAIAPLTRHVFDTRFTPLKIRVNGRVGRRVILVLGSDRKHYRVLDMDFRAGKGNGKGKEADEKEDNGGGGSGSGEEGSDMDMDAGM